MMTTKNVLVCEDDPVQLKVLTSLINQAGYRSLPALTPGEAMMKARRCGIDAVVTDVVLPEGNGFDLVSDLRRLGVDAPVFMTSAHATEGMKARARNAGVKFFFEKPLSLRSIRDRVDAVLRNSKKLDATVLVVESNPDLRARLEKSVADAGFTVCSVETGDEALQAISPLLGRTDLCLMNLHTTGASGAVLIRKALAILPSLKVVMMTDDAGRDEIRAGYEAGASALIRKSIPTDRLQSFLQGSFRALQVERENEAKNRERSERRAAEPLWRKAVRWLKSCLQAPSRSRKGRSVMALAGALLGLAIGAGVAAGVQYSYEQADRMEAMMERAMERTAPLQAATRSRQADAVGRLHAVAQLELMREANGFTRRYYEGHLEELRRQAVLTNAPRPAQGVSDPKSPPRRD